MAMCSFLFLAFTPNTETSPTCKEHSLFKAYFDKLTFTLDIDNLLPHFIAKGIITIEDCDEIRSKPRVSQQVHLLLKRIEGPLKKDDKDNFYILLDVMDTYGNRSTKKLAARMQGMQMCMFVLPYMLECMGIH